MNAEPWVVALSLLLVGVPFAAVLIYGGLVLPVQEIAEAWRDRRSRSHHARRAGRRDGRRGGRMFDGAGDESRAPGGDIDRPLGGDGDRPGGGRGGAGDRVPCGAVSHERAANDRAANHEREGTE